MKKELLDYTNWLLDMDRLKVTSQLPPFEDAEMMVEFYMKAKNKLTFENKDVQITITHIACECNPEWIKAKTEINAFPYGDNLSYDECEKCGRKQNICVVSILT